MSKKPQTKPKGKSKAKRAAEIKPILMADLLTGGPKAGNVEISALEACIRAMDEAHNAFGAIPVQRQDSELRGIVNDWQDRRVGVLRRLERVKQRNEE